MPKQLMPLETVSAKDLLTQPIEPLAYTIDGILPHGLFILAGSSKVGKSWLSLDMSNCVASGDTFWNYRTTQGDVLYLALEDNNKRLQERLNKVSPVCDIDTPTDIHFVTKAEKLGYGLSEQIAEFLDAYTRTKLIVIDTLQHIRNSGKYIGTYFGDYHDMDALREIISGRDISMLLITHNHKSDESDPVNRVHGSAGLIGAVDGIFVLEKRNRNSDKAKLTIANRDTDSYQFDLWFDKSHCRWQLVGIISDDTDGENNLYELFDLLLDETPVWTGTATQLRENLMTLDPTFLISPIGLSKTLKNRQEFLRSHRGIECVFSRNKAMRLIELSRRDVVADGGITESLPLELTE